MALDPADRSLESLETSVCAGAGDGFENEKGSCLNFFSAGIVTMTAPLRQLLPVADLEIAGGGMMGPNNRPHSGRRMIGGEKPWRSSGG